MSEYDEEEGKKEGKRGFTVANRGGEEAGGHGAKKANHRLLKLALLPTNY